VSLPTGKKNYHHHSQPLLFTTNPQRKNCLGWASFYVDFAGVFAGLERRNRRPNG
jgi:hypothetical protein